MTVGAEAWPQFVVVSLTLLVLGIAFVAGTRRRSRKPPGPRGWPLLGNLLSLGTRPHDSLAELAKTHGPIMFLRLGSVPTVVVSSPAMAREVLKTHDGNMANRSVTAAAMELSYNGNDIAFSPYGPSWRQLKKMCTAELLTSSRISQFQAMRKVEVLFTLQSILEGCQEGKAVTVSEFLSNMTMNNITQMMLNKSYCGVNGDSGSAGTVAFTDIVHEHHDLMGAFNIADYFPIFKPFDVHGIKKRTKIAHKKMNDFLQTIIDEHLEKHSSTGTDEKPSGDFLDVILSRPKDDNETLSMNATVQDMITGSTDTTASTVEWALADIVAHPEAMRKLEEEMDSVVGRDRLVEESDIANLEYLQAVVKETLRLHPIAPLLLPHRSIKDCEIAGHHIAGGTRIIINIWAIHRDPELWERPMEFDPNRFLDSKIDITGQNFELLPFGSGRRMCPGLNLGMLMVQYPLAMMVQTARWSLPDNQKPEDVDFTDTCGLVCRKAFPLRVIAEPRLPHHILYPM